MLKRFMLRLKLNDKLLDEIANGIVEYTEEGIDSNLELKATLDRGNPISIEKKQFNATLKMALKGAGYLLPYRKINALSDNVITKLVDKGYHIGVTNDAVILRLNRCEI